MAKDEPTNPTSTGGTTPVTCTSAACCPARAGTHEISGRFNRIFQQYGRSTVGFATRAAVRANMASVRWESYYYNPVYSYHLAYQGTVGSRGRLVGRLTITIRCRATPHTIPPALLAAAPTHFTAVTAANITNAFAGWNTAVQQHWTNRRYLVEVGAPDCPGDYAVNFVLTQVASGAHRNITVLNQRRTASDPAWAAILANPAHARYPTALQLKRMARSNAIKFNMGDPRGNLVFAHEYGHWIGWGDEYLEGTVVPSTTSATGSMYAEERPPRSGTWLPPRVAIRFVNPTLRFRSANPSNIETVDITTAGAQNWLMSSMVSRQTYRPRFIYTVVDDFIRVYNRDHYGGGTSAFCNDVKLARP